MNRRHLNRILIAGGIAPALLLAGSPASAQSPAPVEGRDYKRLEPPQPAPAAGKIEVLEFFSYACPHCSAFEPTLQAWAQRLPADVVLRRVPVPFLFNAENFQRAYYTLETLDLVDAMQSKIFTASMPIGSASKSPRKSPRWWRRTAATRPSYSRPSNRSWS